MGKATSGNFFEDFSIGQVLLHPVPRTVTDGDMATYISLTGDRRPLHCASTFAHALGYRQHTINDWLVFHIVFGKTVGEISLNAVANLGYADGHFLSPVYPGDTLRAESEVIGLRENKSGTSGIVWVRTRGINQHGEDVLRYCRWVMVHKRDPKSPARRAHVPTLPESVPAKELITPGQLHAAATHEWAWATGGRALWDDYEIGETVFHRDGMTIDETDHTSATRLYQNTARVHFDAHQMEKSRFGKRLVYGGHVISVAAALAYNGFENVIAVLALNGGQHANPTFAGDTIYAFSEVLDRAELVGRADAGALRVRLCAVKNANPGEDKIERRVADDKGQLVPHPQLVLELDQWLLVPRR